MFFYMILLLAAAINAAYFPASTANSTASANTSVTTGTSRCIAENVHVSVRSNNTKLLLAEPANQTVATETFQEFLQANSNLFARVNGGPNTITGKFRIYGKLCFPLDPKAAKEAQTVQFLTHGDTLDSTYWDIAPGYSYIDAAVAAGYATFSYDRIGVGRSEHPDPNQVVQGPIQVEIAHALVTLLRDSKIGPVSFKKVVGVGHSAGSTVTNGVTTKYPKDFDAVILTGTSTSAAFVNTALASFDLTIANTDPSRKFASLSNGYLVQPLQQSIQFPYYRWPNFDPKNLAISVANKQTQTFGELLTLGAIVAPSPLFIGPVDIVLGENDLVFCGGNCLLPEDQSALYAPVFYPAAPSSQHYIVPGTGHAIFAHYSAPKAFAQMLAFLATNGL